MCSFFKVYYNYGLKKIYKFTDIESIKSINLYFLNLN